MTVIEQLSAGTYYLFDANSVAPGAKPTLTTLQVSGPGGSQGGPIFPFPGISPLPIHLPFPLIGPISGIGAFPIHHLFPLRGLPSHSCPRQARSPPATCPTQSTSWKNHRSSRARGQGHPGFLRLRHTECPALRTAWSADRDGGAVARQARRHHVQPAGWHVCPAVFRCGRPVRHTARFDGYAQGSHPEITLHDKGTKPCRSVDQRHPTEVKMPLRAPMISAPSADKAG